MASVASLVAIGGIGVGSVFATNVSAQEVETTNSTVAYEQGYHRSETGERPEWAGANGTQDGTGSGTGERRQLKDGSGAGGRNGAGQGLHDGSGEGFVDADGDGICDNQ